MHTKLSAIELDIFSSLPDIQVVFDVGARADNDYLTIKPNIELHAFEPNPVFFKELCDKIGNRGKTYLINYGLSDVAGTLPYNNRRQMFIGGEELSVTEGEQHLGLMTLEEYCAERKVNHIDYLKIDTEGYDYKVLMGGRNMIPKCHYIQYEYWNNKEQFHQLLEQDFYMMYIGERNVFCQKKIWQPTT
jgi:FkbM family methyltransferase